MTEETAMGELRQELQKARTAIDEIRVRHSKIRGKIEDPFIKVGYAVPIDRGAQMSPVQLGLSTVAADKHGRLWMETREGWVLVHDAGLHRMGGRLDRFKRGPGIAGADSLVLETMDAVADMFAQAEWYVRKPTPAVRAWRHEPGVAWPDWIVLTSASLPSPGDWLVMMGGGCYIYSDKEFREEFIPANQRTADGSQG